MAFGLFLKIFIVASMSMGAVAYLIYVERKVAAYAQDRDRTRTARAESSASPSACSSPWRTGPRCCSRKASFPAYVNKPLYMLAPIIAIVAAMIGFAVVPFGPVGPGQFMDFVDRSPTSISGSSTCSPSAASPSTASSWQVGPPIINTRSSVRLRSSAQLISYEIPIGLSILGLVLCTGSLDLNAIINWQDDHIWGVFVSPIGFLIFLVSAFAETNRLPFDLPESEQELIGGFHTEYSGMKFGMFFLGEYVHVITVSFLTVILFFGGWDFPFSEPGSDGNTQRCGQGAS